MFLRFVGTDVDPRTGQPEGLMTIAYRLRDSGALDIADEVQLKLHLDWMAETVPIPSRFARGRNVNHKETHGLSWVRADATECVGHLYAIAEIVGRHGVVVNVLQTARPGYVVHEDDWQVVAEPFHGERP
jgi:hypothetical protein